MSQQLILFPSDETEKLLLDPCPTYAELRGEQLRLAYGNERGQPGDVAQLFCLHRVPPRKREQSVRRSSIVPVPISSQPRLTLRRTAEHGIQHELPESVRRVTQSKLVIAFGKTPLQTRAAVPAEVSGDAGFVYRRSRNSGYRLPLVSPQTTAEEIRRKPGLCRRGISWGSNFPHFPLDAA